MTENNKPIDSADKMQKIISLCKRRGFIYPGSEIYGGLANSWDFGPLGVQLKKNIKDLWWQYFVAGRDDILGIDAALMMNPKVWEASGHVQGFTDPLVECKECHMRFREDYLQMSNVKCLPDQQAGQMLNAHLKSQNYKNNLTIEHFGNNDITNKDNPVFNCPQCDGELSSARHFNLMFKTHIGPIKDKGSEVYLRPETAQAMFVNFKNILDSTRVQLPFGIAQIGKAFRNEITPGNFIFRVLEFEQMEIEYFFKDVETHYGISLQSSRAIANHNGRAVACNGSTWQTYFQNWQKEMSKWLNYIGVNRQNWLIREHQKDELSHYSKKTVDFEYKFPFGQKELYGLAFRTDFDLKNHQKFSGQNLEYRDPQTGESFIPHVIEPTFGVERTILAVLCDAFEEIKGGRARQDGGQGQDSRQEQPARTCRSGGEIVLRLDKKIAPVKVAVFPLVKKDPLLQKAREIVKLLRTQLSYMLNFVIAYDENGTIGRRYRRQDEIGTPYCLTVDFESLEDGAITVRDRDTMEQERVGVGELGKYLEDKFRK